MSVAGAAPVRRGVWMLAAMIWIAAASSGLWVLWAYDNQPGEPAAALDRWPDGSGLARAADRPTLVMLVHPRCSCSRASVDELAEILARAATQPRTYVLFLRPDAAADGWEQTDLWRQVSALPGVTARVDRGGTVAAAFGGATSGQTFLYDAGGTLRFSGGITGARGHAGENAGRTAMIALLRSASTVPGSGGRAWTKVFGCSLFGSGGERRTGA